MTANVLNHTASPHISSELIVMSCISGILFDKDGVFVDFEKTWTPEIGRAHV